MRKDLAGIYQAGGHLPSRVEHPVLGKGVVEFSIGCAWIEFKRYWLFDGEGETLSDELFHQVEAGQEFRVQDSDSGAEIVFSKGTWTLSGNPVELGSDAGWKYVQVDIED